MERLRALYLVDGHIDIDKCDQAKECSHICQVQIDAEPVCLCPKGWKLVNDYKCEPTSNCRDNEFGCDGKCYSKIIRCDGTQGN